jgi:uncharacterized protein YbjT (DUF2867 family)
MVRKAIIVGASGLVGSNLINLLLNGDNYTEVLSIARKEVPIQHKKLVQLIINLHDLFNHEHALKGDVIFCCLGTTLRKTPDKTVYRKIDHDYPVELAKLAIKNNVNQYHFVSAVGADITSSSFYTRLKGETEQDLIKVKLNTLHIYRPSLLTGDRKEFRFAEKTASILMKAIDPLLIGGLKKYRSIPASTVAQAMYNQSLRTESGLFIHPSHHIKNLA